MYSREWMAKVRRREARKKKRKSALQKSKPTKDRPGPEAAQSQLIEA
jgi:hypothetical protein